MEFAIAFIDSDGSEKSASIKAISEHKALEFWQANKGKLITIANFTKE